MTLGKEQMGTKAKFWYRAPNGEEWLFKFARDRTGEHWSEKIASEIGAALGVPCAHVELAYCDGLLGSVSRSFIDSDQESLVHGNELLQEVDGSYPSSQLRGVSKYTVDAVSPSPRTGSLATCCSTRWSAMEIATMRTGESFTTPRDDDAWLRATITPHRWAESSATRPGDGG